MPNIRSTISFGLVNIPVLLNPIIHNNDSSFHQLHKKCGHRITYKKYCPICKIPLKETDILKGYEYEREEYVEFTKIELTNLKPENEGILEIVSFISLKEIDPTYFEKSYLLTTSKQSKAYSLFGKALHKSNLVALCKTVLHNKFYYGIIRFYEDKIILTTLYFKEEVNLDHHQIEAKVEPQELSLAIKLIENMQGKFEPQKYKDEYQLKLKQAIEDKINGKSIKKSKATPKKQVNDLMKALEKSLKR